MSTLKLQGDADGARHRIFASVGFYISVVGEKPRPPSVAGGFVAGFLLLRATKKA